MELKNKTGIILTCKTCKNQEVCPQWKDQQDPALPAKCIEFSLHDLFDDAGKKIEVGKLSVWPI